MLCINKLATTVALIAGENKIPKVSGLGKKTDYDAEIRDIKDKYFTTSDYEKFTNNMPDVSITAKKLVNESGLSEKKKKASATKEKIKKISSKGRIESTARYDSKTSNIRFKSFIG